MSAQEEAQWGTMLTQLKAPRHVRFQDEVDLLDRECDETVEMTHEAKRSSVETEIEVDTAPPHPKRPRPTNEAREARKKKKRDAPRK